jgi:integrase
MAKTTHQLTAIKVANTKRKGLHPDGNGLYLRVTESGTKGWIYRYTVDGKARDMGLGPLASVSLAEARVAADECRRQRREGLNPIEARKARQATESAAAAGSPTFMACAEQLIAAHEVGWRNAKHRQQWKNTLATFVYPIMGSRSVADVDTELVMRVLQQPVEQERGKRTPLWNARSETASRLRGRIESVLSWAKARGLRTGENPAQWRGHLDQLLPVRSKVRRVRHHPALPYTEIGAFMADVRARESIGARALEFTILTAARTSEALGARFDEIDLVSRLWTVPASRMKAANEHRVPLAPRAVTIVKAMAAIQQNEFVFPGMKQGRSLSDMSLLMLLRDLRPGITTHGFRSTFKDWCSECTHTPNFVSEAALAHSVADKVEAAYRRADLLEKRRVLMEAWAEFCGRKPVPADVIPLRVRAAKASV